LSNLQRTEEWYRQYGEAVYRRCRRLLGDEALAWDFTQEVFLRAHQQASALRQAPSALSWLLTIADRQCLSALRRRRVEERAAQAERVHALAVPASDEALEQALVAADLVTHVLAHCAEDVQQIVVHRFIDELEQEQIAQLLDISRKTVIRKLQAFYATARALLERAPAPTALGAQGKVSA
jgi:RNA polymerase sigma factor (sigma-70 family)